MDLFWTVVIALVILWLLGFFAGLGNLIHLLLVIALIIVVYRLWKGKNVLTGK
jgi:hypothetical protein